METLLKHKPEQGFVVRKVDDVFYVEAPWMVKVLSKVDPEDYESLQYFQRVLRSSGILDELVSGARRAGMALVATTPLESRELEQWLYDSCLGGVYDRLLQRSPFASVGTNNYEKAERVRSVARLIGA